jgi:DNA-binding NtrC family response regulator
MMTGTRVVYVEDDPAQERLVREILQREGSPLEAVGTARGAFELLMAQPPDAALVDLRLPDGSGIDLIRELRAQGADLPLVVVTASEAPEDAVAALKAGAEEYLVKPIVPALLIEAVRRAMATVRRQRDLSRLWAEIGRTTALPEVARDNLRLRKLLRQVAEAWSLEPGGDAEPLPEGSGLLQTVDRVERKLIREALERTGWVKARAARALGVTERILSYKMQNLGIERPGTGQSCQNPTKTSALP